jgi:hypothetical protein
MLDIGIPRSVFIWNSNASIYDSSFTVVFPKTPDIEVLLIGAELHQDIHMHDRLTLHIKGRPWLKSTAIVNGDPMIFTYISGKIKSTFNGYVSAINQANGMDGANTDIECVSASYVLKETDQKIYKNMTADRCVVNIGNKHGFSTTVQRHSRVRSAIVQSGQTDWQLLTSLATQCGFALVVENTHITFVSKDKIFNSKKAKAPYYYYVDDEITGLVTKHDRLSGSIFSFAPIIADENPDSGIAVDRVVSGKSTTTGQPFKTTHTINTLVSPTSGAVTNFSNNPTKAKFKKHHTHEVVTSLANSKLLAIDYANQHRYRHRAEVMIIGTADLRPYDPIYLDGLPNGMSGYWTVLSLKHIFNGRVANYMLEIVVGTDTIGDTSSTAYLNANTRDVQAELAGQSLVAPASQLIDQVPSINASSLSSNTNTIVSTPQVSPSNPLIPNLTNIPFPNGAPNINSIKRTVQWTATKTGTVIA